MTSSPSTLRQLYERLGPEGYRRAMAAACWEAGNLSYSLNEPQRRLRSLWYANKARGERRTVAKWARRVGKTRTCSALAFESALAGPRKRILYAAQTQAAVKEFVVPHFVNLAGDAPDHLRPELVGNEMRFQNGSRIVLQGCEDRLKADRLRGPAADDAFVDEGGFIPVLGYVVRDVIRPQFATTGGAMMLASSPPEAPDHPFDDFANEALARGAYLHFTVHDAPHLTPEEIADWCRDVGGPDSIAWQREGLAMSVTDPTRAVLPEFSEHMREVVGEVDDDGVWRIDGAPVARPAHFHPLIVGDLGYVDMTVVLFGYVDFLSGALVVEDELSIRRPTSDIIQRQAAQKASALWGERPPLLRKLDGPPITVGDIARLERADLADPSAQPDKWATVYNGELSAAVNALRLRIKQGRLVVHPRCTTLIAHARSARWNQARSSFERMQTDDGQHHYDGCAALVYLAREARNNEHRNPFPRLPSGIHPHTHRIPPELLGPDRRIDKFKKAFSAKRERR